MAQSNQEAADYRLVLEQLAKEGNAEIDFLLKSGFEFAGNFSTSPIVGSTVIGLDVKKKQLEKTYGVNNVKVAIAYNKSRKPCNDCDLPLKGLWIRKAKI